MKYINKMTEFNEKDPETGSYMKYMIHTLASGAGGRGYESRIARIVKKVICQSAIYHRVKTITILY
jgi:hypothetical protein